MFAVFRPQLIRLHYRQCVYSPVAKAMQHGLRHMLIQVIADLAMAVCAELHFQ